MSARRESPTTPSGPDLRTTPAPSGTPEFALRATDLVVEYGARKNRFRALDGVSIEIRRGEAVGIVGESGSGKSSLAMAIAGLGPLTSGTLVINGAERASRSRQDRADVQVVLQDSIGSLDPRQSVQSAFKELRSVHGRRTSWISDTDLMSLVGLPVEILERYPHQMSGGQAQRVCIALGLLLKPTVLVADEPTSALDVRVQAQIIALLNTLRKQERLTILFVSHDFAVVRQLCDRTYVMCRGRTVESGSTAEVIDNPQHDYTRKLIAALPGRARLLPGSGVGHD